VGLLGFRDLFTAHTFKFLHYVDELIVVDCVRHFEVSLVQLNFSSCLEENLLVESRQHSLRVQHVIRLINLQLSLLRNLKIKLIIKVLNSNLW